MTHGNLIDVVIVSSKSHEEKEHEAKRSEGDEGKIDEWKLVEINTSAVSRRQN